MTYILWNGKQCEAGKSPVSLHDRGFRYGDGIFETLRVECGVPYQLAWHMARLARGCEALRIPFNTTNLPQQCAALLAANGITQGLLRIQVTRGEGGRGYLPDAHMRPNCLVETLPMPEVPATPVSLWLSSYRKPSLQSLPVRMKLCQGVNSTLARMEAADHQCFEALQLGENGHIAETSSANIFWLKGGTLYTPSLECGVLEGATRAAILRLAPYPVHEVAEGTEALAAADAVCITNTVWKALPVEKLLPADHTWDSTALAARLREALTRDIERECGTGKATRNN